MEAILDIFRALADPTRIRIMLLLLKMELAVGELAQILEQSQPRISRHIRILDEAGLAERREEGSRVFLRPGQAAELDILRRLFRSDTVISSQQAVHDEAKLALVRKARAEMAEQYFKAHAEEWDAIRSLHLPEDAVEQAMLALLKDVNLGHFLDIGTGTGRLVEVFRRNSERTRATRPLKLPWPEKPNSSWVTLTICLSVIARLIALSCTRCCTMPPIPKRYWPKFPACSVITERTCSLISHPMTVKSYG